MFKNLATLMHLHSNLEAGMYQSILEYIVNADLYYRLWMAAQLQNPEKGPFEIIQPRTDWIPELVNGMFEDIRLVPGVVRETRSTYLLDSEFRFHTGDKRPTIDAAKLEMMWGVTASTYLDNPMKNPIHPVRALGPCKIALSGLKMWHHQDIIHRRRGDAVICEMAVFEWNTRKSIGGSYRTDGPIQVTIKNFRAAFNKGTPTDVSYENLSASWGTENGIRLGEQRVQEVIKKNDIGVNYHMTESVFADPGEEFIFWDEIGRKQEAA